MVTKVLDYKDCEVCGENLPLQSFTFLRKEFSNTCKVCAESGQKKERINQVKEEEQKKYDKEWEDFYFYVKP